MEPPTSPRKTAQRGVPWIQYFAAPLVCALLTSLLGLVAQEVYLDQYEPKLVSHPDFGDLRPPRLILCTHWLPATFAVTFAYVLALKNRKNGYDFFFKFIFVTVLLGMAFGVLLEFIIHVGGYYDWFVVGPHLFGPHPSPSLAKDDLAFRVMLVILALVGLYLPTCLIVGFVIGYVTFLVLALLEPGPLDSDGPPSAT
jgi:hypothetical protein